MTKKIIDYSGKKVNVGIDVHKKTYVVSCRCEGQEVKKAVIPAVPEKLVTFLKFHFSGAEIYSVYEAGFSGFTLHRTLVLNDIKNTVVNPSSIEVAANDKAKTDKRDSRKMAEQLEVNRLKGIHVPPLEQEERRLITRTRDQLVKNRTSAGNRFKSRLSQFGLISFNDETAISKRFIDEYLDRKLSTELHEALSVLARLWKFLDSEIKELSRKIAKIGGEEKLAILYRSVPGIGPLSSLALAAELGDMSQFRNERTIFKHTGLIPTEYSSGDRIRKGHITRQGSSRLRHLLTEAAWKAVEKDPRLTADFRRIAVTRGKKRAIVAIARKLIGRIRACVKKNEAYQLDYQAAA